MDYNFNFNGTLPWIYKKEKYADKVSSVVYGSQRPNVVVGGTYYTKLDSIGWTEVIVKSYVLIDNHFAIIVKAPNNVEYALTYATNPFFYTEEDVANYLSDKKYVSVPYVDSLNKFEFLFRNTDFATTPFMNTLKFIGYKYKNGKVIDTQLNIKYLWIDENGLHYKLTSDDMLYTSKTDAVMDNLSIMKFDDEETESINEKKFSIIVEVTAKSIEDAILKIKIEE